jgi:hypothetical protein
MQQFIFSVRGILSLCSLFVLILVFARPLTVSEILTQSTWTSVETWRDENFDGVFVKDTFPCQSDNDWAFAANSNISIFEDSLRCEEEPPYMDTISGTWNLTQNSTLISMDLGTGGDEIQFKIYAIGPSELILLSSGTDDPDDPTYEKLILRR